MIEMNPQVQFKPKTQVAEREKSRSEVEGDAIEIFTNMVNFANAQRIAQMMTQSTLIPKDYQGNIANIIVALEMSYRMKASPLMVMQNLHVIQGRPSWSAQFVIACVNNCGRFSPLSFEFKKLGTKTVTYSYTYWDSNKQKQRKEAQVTIEDMSCRATAKDLRTGETIVGPTVTVEMAVKEGWYTKDGSKWPTMPELMLRYRAATFFGRLYAPELLMGMPTVDEVEDAIYTEIPEKPKVDIRRAEQSAAPSIKAEDAPESTETPKAEEIPAETPKAVVIAPEAPETEEPEPKPVQTKKKSEKPKTELPEVAEAQDGQLFEIDGVEIVDPPKYDFVDTEEIIMFLENSETMEEFEANKDKIKVSYNKLSQAEKNKVMTAAETMKKVLEEAR